MIISLASFQLLNNKGYTNCGAGVISGRTNLKNNRLTITKEKHDDYSAKSKGGDGSKRKYILYGADAFGLAHFALGREEGRNNTSKNFLYSVDFRIEQIKHVNWAENIEYGKFIFYRDNLKKKLQAKVSGQGKEVLYNFIEDSYKQDNIKWTQYYIKSVIRPTKPLVIYEYVAAEGTKNYKMLREKAYPKNRFLHVEYYKKGSNKVGNKEIQIKKSDDPAIDKVMLLKAPVGEGKNPTPVIIYRFFYNFQKDKHDEVIGGTTEVLDAYDNKTIYQYDDQHRLFARKKCVGPQAVHSQEFYFWGKKGTSDEGNLIAAYFKDGAGIIKQGKVFYYDAQGNITHLREYGQVTGTNAKPIAYNEQGLPIENGAEYSLRTFQYGLNNRLVEEREANSKTIRYDYLSDTDLLLSKSIIDHTGKIVFRESYQYDLNLFLVAKTIDEGEGTSQKITHYTPRMKVPYGIPEEIEETYKEAGQEHLLERKINHYSDEGYLISQEHYDSEGKLRFTLRWEYDNHGNIISQTNALNQSITRKYDENDNLIFEEGPCVDFYTIFDYDFSNRLISTTQYHKDGKVLTTSHRYDYLGNRISTTDLHGNTTQCQYDAFGHVKKMTYPVVLNGQNQAIQPTEDFEYDILGHCTQKVDKRGFATHYEYNVHGKPLSILYPDGTTEKFIYNLDGSLAKTINKDQSYVLYNHNCFGRLTKKEIYSPQGELLSKQEFEYSYFHLLAEVDEEGQRTEYQYDAAGRLSAKIKGDQKTSYEYDTLSRVAKEIYWISDSEACVKAYNYDLLNRILEERIQDLSGKTLSSTKFDYNVLSQKILVTTGKSTERIIYNSRQEPIKIIDAEGTETNIHYQYDYCNALNQNVTRITTTDPLGNAAVQEMDALGRIVEESCFNSKKQLLARKKNFFNPEGDLEMVQHDRIVSGALLSSVQHVWIYDAARKLISFTEAVGTTEQCTRKYDYNAYGQKTTLIKPDGVKLSYTYDGKGRLATVQSSDQSINYSYAYNRKDQVVQCTDGKDNHVTLRSYDAAGRLKHETLGNGLTISFEYDLLDRKIQLTLPDKSSIQYVYDPLFLREVSRTKNNKRLYTHRYEQYDLAGNLLKSTLPLKAGVLEYTYDKLHRERTIRHPARTQEIPSNGFDKIGNLLRLTVKDALGKQDSRFAYDDLHQLVLENGDEDHQYQYDSLYNRIAKDKSDCSISTLNHLLGQEGIEYKYDLNGNLIEKNDHGMITKYTYDAWNRLTTSFRGDQKTKYTYDAFHRRLSKDQELYLYDGQDEIACYKRGQIQTLRILGISKAAEIGGAIAYEMDNKIFIPLHDHNGNIASLLNPDGTVFKAYRYTAFGIELDAEPSDNNPWRYCSKHFDPETGFIYFGRRYYDANIGRWTTPDPAEYDDGPNLHAYVHNNPLGNFDAYGLWALPSWENTMDFGNRIGTGLCNLAAQASEFLGNIFCTIGRELMPCPLLKDLFQFPGHLLRGNSPSSYVMSYRETHSYYKLVGTGTEGFSSNMIITNGISVSSAEAEERTRKSYNSVDGRYDTYVSYNADHGFMSNIFECVGQFFGVKTHATEVLGECMTAASETRGDGGKTWINAHSQGGLTLYDVGRTISQSISSNVDAFTIGSPVAIPNGMYGSVKNMTASWDFVSWGTRMYNGAKSCLGGRSAPIDVMCTRGSVLKAHNFDGHTYKTATSKRLDKIRGF